MKHNVTLNTNYKLTVDSGTEQVAKMYVIKPGLTTPVRIYSPIMELDTSALTSAVVSFECWHNVTVEPYDPEYNFIIYYSTDNGATWSGTLDYTVTTAETNNVKLTTANHSGPLTKVVTENICEKAANKKITNIKVLPFGTTVGTAGAFRLIDFQIEVLGDGFTLKDEAVADTVVSNDSDTVSIPASANTYSLEDSEAENWKTNNSASAIPINRNYYAKVSDTEQYNATLFPPDNVLRVYSPIFALDTAALTSAELSFTYLKNPDTESALDIMIYYSLDEGETWAGTLNYTTEETQSTATLYNKSTNAASSITGQILKLTTGNICEQVEDKIITNLKIVPFGNANTDTSGAFRVIDIKINTDGDGFTLMNKAVSDTVISNDYEPPTVNDSPTIQAMIDAAIADGTNEVTIGVNPRDNSSEWIIGESIVLPSNITVKIKDATLRLADGVFCNIFYSQGAYEPASALTAEDALTNIKIIGEGDAVLHGGTHNGITVHEAGYPDIVRNTFIFFRNVENFEVSNLKMVDSRWWASTFIFCENGIIEDIEFDSRNTVINQDGIDLRIGCNNIKINNISGTTGDDTIALTALLHKFDNRWLVSGKETDIHDVTITNIKAASACGVIRLLAQDGNKVYNVYIDNVYDLALDGKFNSPEGVIRIGEQDKYATSSSNQAGDINNVVITNVTAGSGTSAIYSASDNVTADYLSYGYITANTGTKFGGTLTSLNSVEDSDFETLKMFKLDIEQVDSNYSAMIATALKAYTDLTEEKQAAFNLEKSYLDVLTKKIDGTVTDIDDANGDEAVDITDLVRMKKYCANQIGAYDATDLTEVRTTLLNR